MNNNEIGHATISVHIDYQLLADLVSDRIRAAHPAAAPDELYPISAIRKQLGRRGKPMAPQTFTKNYIETGLIPIVDHPNDRRSQYTTLSAWVKLKNESLKR
jgi:hypothetical protein